MCFGLDIACQTGSSSASLPTDSHGHQSRSRVAWPLLVWSQLHVCGGDVKKHLAKASSAPFSQGATGTEWDFTIQWKCLELSASLGLLPACGAAQCGPGTSSTAGMVEVHLNQDVTSVQLVPCGAPGGYGR